MEKTYRLIFLLLSFFSCANVCSQQKPLPMEQPELRNKKELVICHAGYSLSYNKNTNCPDWVAWELTEDKAYAVTAKRTNDFRGDPDIPPLNRVEGYDYKESGYDRGHMCPAGDMKWSATAMSESFYMSNICPQTTELNQKWWEHLEKACRRWTSQEGKIYVCCGPIFNNKIPPKYIGNEVKVRVPDGFFKVVLSLNKGQEKAIGFIYKNNYERQTMESTATTVDEVENITGFNFFPQLDKKLEDRIEGTFNLRRWN